MRCKGLFLRVFFLAYAAVELGPCYAFVLLVSQFVPPIFVVLLVANGTNEFFFRLIRVLAHIFAFAPFHFDCVLLF